jgi:protein-S-isoprenylcysteine O-methyltransferase Ste14
MNNSKDSISPRVIIQVIFIVVLVPFLPLLISRRWDWWQAWVYAIVSILGFAISRALAARRNPDLLRERARMMEHTDTEPWDNLLAPLVGLGGALIPLVAGLEALLVGVSPLPLRLTVFSFVVFVGGYVLGSYALIENRFFSGVVRIQFERGHEVVSSGPYRWIRHPGYAAAILAYLASPVFLNTLWAFLPAIFITVVLIIRTRLEDQTLLDRLQGYSDYAAQVRYRLLPGIW